MTIKEGDRLPEGKLLKAGDSGVETVETASLTGRVALFGLPGAFTGTCSTKHLPSFIDNAEGFRGKGIDRIICVTVNDPFVVKAWSDQTGAEAAGVEVLSDADGSFAKALGLSFDAPQFGMYGRSQRFAMLLRDGVVEALNLEDAPGGYGKTSGEALLERA